MCLPTDFAHRTSVVAHMTYLKKQIDELEGSHMIYLISNGQAIAFAFGRVVLALVTNTHGAKTDSTAKEQQNKCANALAD